MILVGPLRVGMSVLRFLVILNRGLRFTICLMVVSNPGSGRGEDGGDTRLVMRERNWVGRESGLFVLSGDNEGLKLGIM